MLRLLTIFLLASCSAAAQADKTFMHEYKKGRSILLYSYIQKNDSAFIYGRVKEKGTDTPILNINILVKDFRIGTVHNTYGNFMLFLPSKKGTIIFDKTGSVYFEFPFEFKKDDLRMPSAHQ